MTCSPLRRAGLACLVGSWVRIVGLRSDSWQLTIQKLYDRSVSLKHTQQDLRVLYSRATQGLSVSILLKW